MPSSGALERLRAANQRAVVGLLAGEGPMSRADLVRASGLSRTTVSSLVAELIRGGQVTETDDRARPHKGGSGRPPVLVRLSAPAGAVAGVDVGHGHVRVAIADRLGAVLAEDHALVDVDAHGAEVLDRAAAMVRSPDACRAASTPPSCRPSGCACPRPSTDAPPGSGPGSCRAGRGCCPVRSSSGGWAYPSTPTTTPTSAPWPSCTRAAPAAGTTSCTSRSPAASAPGSCSAAGCTAERAGSPARSATSRSARTARCAGAATVAAWRRWSPPPAARAAPAGVRRAAVSIEQVLALDDGGDAGVRRVLSDAGRIIGRAVADLANSLNPELVVVGGTVGRHPRWSRGCGRRSTATPSPTPRPPSRWSPARSGTAPSSSAPWPWPSPASPPAEDVSPSADPSLLLVSNDGSPFRYRCRAVVTAHQ